MEDFTCTCPIDNRSRRDNVSRARVRVLSVLNRYERLLPDLQSAQVCVYALCHVVPIV